MSNGRRLPGRPSKGDRAKFRVAPMASAEISVVLAEASARDMPYGDYIAVIVAGALGLDAQLPERMLPLVPSGLAASRPADRALVTRVPRLAADRLMREATERGVSYSVFIAAVLVRAHGFDAKLPEPVRLAHPHQQEVLISA